MVPKLDLFTIDTPNSIGTGWQPRYVRARNFRVTREGALVFYSWPWVRVAAFPPGTWPRGVARLSEVDAREIAKRLSELQREAK